MFNLPEPVHTGSRSSFVTRRTQKTKHFDDPGGAGFEIAREVLACARCAFDYRMLKERQAKLR